MSGAAGLIELTARSAVGTLIGLTARPATYP
jgi:hypothetical protein